MQATIRDDTKEIKTLETELRRLPKDSEYDAQREEWKERIERDKAEIEALKQQIPEEWQPKYKEFSALEKKHSLARNLYRRNVDQAFEPAQKLSVMLSTTDAFAALESDFTAIGEHLAAGDAAKALENVDTALPKIRDLPGSYDLDRAVVEVQRALKREPANIEDARSAFEKAESAYRESLAWRTAATDKVKPGIDAYVTAIGDTIGLRMLERLPEKIALEVAVCRSDHRDLSLSF